MYQKSGHHYLWKKTVGPLTEIIKFVYQLGLLARYQLLQIVYPEGHLYGLYVSLPEYCRL